MIINVQLLYGKISSDVILKLASFDLRMLFLSKF